MAEELLNLDFFNELDVNLDYLDQYLGLENKTTNDLNHKFESNINSYNNYNQNIDLNSAQNQCFDSNNGFENQNNCQIRYETYNNFNQINGYEWMSQKDQVFNPPLIPTVNTSVFDSYYCQQIDGQLSSNPFNGFNSNGIDSNLIQKFWEPIENPSKESYGQEIPPNPSTNQEIPESVVQLSGQLLSTQEFKEETQMDLICEEKIPEGSPEDTQNQVINDFVPKEDTKDSLYTTSVGNQMTINIKTYSRLNGMMSTTMDAATGLVMLSTPVVRPKLKKRSFIQMSFADRLRLKRERNRIAAKKCRQKKLEKIEFLEKRKEFLLQENLGYEEYLRTQRQRLFELKTLLFSHRLTECRLEKNYI